MMNNKYRNRPMTVNGERFDSIKEYRRYCELRTMEKAGQIQNLRRQVRYELLPTQKEPDRTGARGGRIRGKVLEQGIYYIADFVYDVGGQTIVEDVKGNSATKTEAYIMKRKMMLFFHSIRVQEI